MKQIISIAACLILSAAWGCSTSHRVEVAPVEVKPIHITIDVNVKVDKALDDFFSDIDQAPAKPEVNNAK
ncbi:hypothetical protein [Pseudodesulfovibrio sp.]|uniref:hypothetical protein n=1 Tax=unclassified Pseudodesulfovibrio TaxID=2661612 RepID=UPI003AFF8B91